MSCPLRTSVLLLLHHPTTSSASASTAAAAAAAAANSSSMEQHLTMPHVVETENYRKTRRQQKGLELDSQKKVYGKKDLQKSETQANVR